MYSVVYVDSRLFFGRVTLNDQRTRHAAAAPAAAETTVAEARANETSALNSVHNTSSGTRPA